MFICEMCEREVRPNYGMTCPHCRPDKPPEEAVKNRAMLRTALDELKSQFPEEEQERRRHLFFIAMTADLLHEESQNRKLTPLENKIYNLTTQHLVIEAKLRVDAIEAYKRGQHGSGPDKQG